MIALQFKKVHKEPITIKNFVIDTISKLNADFFYFIHSQLFHVHNYVCNKPTNILSDVEYSYHLCSGCLTVGLIVAAIYVHVLQ